MSNKKSESCFYGMFIDMGEIQFFFCRLFNRFLRKGIVKSELIANFVQIDPEWLFIS